MKFNIMGPVIILLVAFTTNQLTMVICTSLGMEKQEAEGIATLTMVVAAIIAFTRMRRGTRKP